MANTTKTPDPYLVELQAIIDGLPKAANALPGLKEIIKFVAKVVKRQTKLDTRVTALENFSDTETPSEAD